MNLLYVMRHDKSRNFALSEGRGTSLNLRLDLGFAPQGSLLCEAKYSELYFRDSWKYGFCI